MAGTGSAARGDRPRCAGGAARPTDIHDTAPVWWKVLLGGTVVGFLTGFLGVGGGFLIVPALVLVLGMSMREAVDSSLVVIAINSVAGLLGHVGESGVSWLPIAQLRQGFAVLVVVLGVALLAINIPKALG